MVSSLVTSISGTLQRTGEEWVEVSMGGITLRISVPSAATDSVGSVGQPVTLYTSLQVREDSISMYGFPTEDERLTFETLLNISGIGPRLALAMLGRFSPMSLSEAVETGDTRALSTVPGVGRRTASRIVLELKGKLDLDFGHAAGGGADSDLIDALTALGYSYAESSEAIGKTGPDVPEEERIRAALDHLSGA